MASPRVVALLSVLVAAACAPLDEPGAGEAHQAIQPPDPQCTEQNCGGPNSPWLDGVPFWALHSGGDTNEEGVAIVGVQRHGTPLRLVVVVDELRALDPDTGIPLFTHMDLVDTVITVSRDKHLFDIRIKQVYLPGAVSGEAYWVGSKDPVESYDFVYSKQLAPVAPVAPIAPIAAAAATGPVGHTPEKPLCSEAIDTPDGPMVRAVVFGGDKYDATKKTITLGEDAVGWMNIACRQGATYKMLLLGHTTAATIRLGIATSPAKRRALLNAVTMNACGDGTAFTKQGTHITLRETQNLLPPTSPYLDPTSRYEAVWTRDGARCISWHRLAKNADDYAKILDDVLDTCGHPIPECERKDDLVDDWSNMGSVITGVP